MQNYIVMGLAFGFAIFLGFHPAFADGSMVVTRQLDPGDCELTADHSTRICNTGGGYRILPADQHDQSWKGKSNQNAHTGILDHFDRELDGISDVWAIRNLRDRVTEVCAQPVGKPHNYIYEECLNLTHRIAAREEKITRENRERAASAERMASQNSRLPKCNNVDLTRFANLLDARQITEGGFNQTENTRRCQALGFFRVGGKSEFNYTVGWIDESNGKYYVDLGGVLASEFLP